MSLMSDLEGFKIPEDENGFINADVLQWLRTLAEFFVEFLNLVSEIILLAFGMKGRFMSRFRCCSKSAVDMSESDSEIKKITNSFRDLRLDDNAITAGVSEQTFAESEDEDDLVSVASMEAKKHERIRQCKFKSKIPRLIPNCVKKSKSDTGLVLPKSVSTTSVEERKVVLTLSNTLPLDFIHNFNSYVRKKNRRLSKTGLINWYRAFTYFIYLNETKANHSCVNDRMIFVAIREKRDLLAERIYDQAEYKDGDEPMSLEKFKKVLINLTLKDMQKYYVKSHGDSGEGAGKVIKIVEDDGSTSKTDEVYPTMTKRILDKTIDIGGGEIMQIITMHYISAKKKAPEQHVPDRGKYPRIYPLPISSDDYVYRKVNTIYKIGKDRATLVEKCNDRHECKPSPYQCDRCKADHERGHLSAKEVYANFYMECHKQLEEKINGSGEQMQPVQQSSEEIQPAQEPEEPVKAAPETQANKTPTKGGRNRGKNASTKKDQTQNIGKAVTETKAFLAQNAECESSNVEEGTSAGGQIDDVTNNDVTEADMNPSSATGGNVRYVNSNPTTQAIQPGLVQKSQNAKRNAPYKRRKYVPPSMDKNYQSCPFKSIHELQMLNTGYVVSINGASNDTYHNHGSPSSNDMFSSANWFVDLNPDPTDTEVTAAQPVTTTPEVATATDVATNTEVVTNVEVITNTELLNEEAPDELHFIDTDDIQLVVEEPKEPVYQDIDATVDLSRNSIEPRFGDTPNKKKLQAEIQIREKIKTKGEANKHLKFTKPKYENYLNDSVGEEFISFEDSGACGNDMFNNSALDESNVNDNADATNEENIEVAVAEPVIVNAVEQPQTMDDREITMIPEEIIRKDTDKLKDVEEMYAVAEKKSKKKKKDKTPKKKNLIVLT